MASHPGSAPSYLLLLPGIAWPISRDSLQATYKTPLTVVLQQLASENCNTGTGVVLDIAVILPFLQEHQSVPRGILYEPVQAVVAGIYKLVCVIAAQQKTNVEDAEGIDVRLLLIIHSSSKKDINLDVNDQHTKNAVGPVIDLRTLAKSDRPYERVYSVANEVGEDLLRQFRAYSNNLSQVNRVEGGEILGELSFSGPESLIVDEKSQRHVSVAVGGTWDHIHIGHKLLLTMFAFMLDGEDQHEKRQPRVLTIGITGDELLKNKKHAKFLQSWDERQVSATNFLRGIMDFRPPSKAKVERKEISKQGPNGHVVLVTLQPGLELRNTEISDLFGPTITDENISALVLSAETRAGGKAVNDKREEKGWQKLVVLEVDVLDADEEEAVKSSLDTSFQSKLSSTSIRKALAEKSQAKSKLS